MKSYFVERGFSGPEVDKTIEEVSSIPRDEALNSKKKGREAERVPFVIGFHPRLRTLSKVLYRHFHILQASDRLKRAFPEAPMVAFRRLQNITDKLIHTNLRGNDSSKGSQEVKACGDPRCKCCQHIQEKNELNINGSKHHVKKGGTCKTENVIYGVSCQRCPGKWYIGETGMKLHSRINGHRASIQRLKKGETLNQQLTDTVLADHFFQVDHNLEQDAKLHILEAGDWRTPGERKKRESYFICKYRTLHPEGLNKTSGPLTDLYGKI